MKDLNSIKWGNFQVQDIFDVKPGKRLTKGNMIPGNTPFIGATDSNNGITCFCGNHNASLDSDVLGVNYNGSVVDNFYHPYRALFSDDVKRLRLKKVEGSKYIYLFIKVSILQLKKKYQYGYKFNGERMNREMIVLPITDDGSPDYAFMEEYMKEIEKRMLLRYKNYMLFAKPDVETYPQEIPNWGMFNITSVFSIKATQSGIDKKRLNSGSGKYPYITRTDRNNGYDDSFVKKQVAHNTDRGNVISVGLDTQTVFYQPYKFYTGQNIQVLSNPNLNRYHYSYIIPLIKLQLKQLNWGGNGATLGRLKRVYIKLPKRKNGMPDYTYMEKYMKAKEAEMLKRYIDYKLAKI